MFDDTRVTVFFPLPIATILLTIFMLFAGGVSIVYRVAIWFQENLITFIIVSVIIALAGSITCGVGSKNLMVGAIHMLPYSQLCFFLAYGGAHLPCKDFNSSNLFEMIWSAIIFVLFALYGSVNLVVVVGTNIVFARSHFRLNGEVDIIEYIFTLVLFGVGWLVNFILFVVF